MFTVILVPAAAVLVASSLYHWFASHPIQKHSFLNTNSGSTFPSFSWILHNKANGQSVKVILRGWVNELFSPTRHAFFLPSSHSLFIVSSTLFGNNSNKRYYDFHSHLLFHYKQYYMQWKKRTYSTWNEFSGQFLKENYTLKKSLKQSF